MLAAWYAYVTIHYKVLNCCESSTILRHFHMSAAATG